MTGGNKLVGQHNPYDDDLHDDDDDDDGNDQEWPGVTVLGPGEG